MKTTLIILFFAIAFLFLAKTTISIHPFRITFERLGLTIGIFLLMIGMCMIMLFSHVEGYGKGYGKGLKDMRIDIQDNYNIQPKQTGNETKNDTENHQW